MLSRTMRPQDRNSMTVDTQTVAARKGLRLLSALLAGLLCILCAAPATAEDSEEILLYHRFGDERYPTTNVTVQQLEAHIAELTSGAYTVLPVAEIIDAYQNGRALPDRTIGITIDDAYASVYEVAYPRFRAAGLPVTLFVSTEPVDAGDGDFMTWDQIREMTENGADIGNHTVTHLHMIGLGDARNGDEISRAQSRITEMTGKAPVLFSYPYGEFGTAEMSLAERSGFKAAFGQYSGVTHAGAYMFSLPRFAMNENYADKDRFTLIVNALPIPAREYVPADPVLGPNPPPFGFTLMADVGSLSQLACYPSHMKEAARMEILGGKRVEVRFDTPFPPGRSRINCTMPGPDGRWRWLGRPFFVQ
jgi:peptidoglycan/xylan/chitin deacetylase (PgdA/CDA1 family)